jgi:adenylate cyclase
VIYRHGLLGREHRQVRAALSRYVAPAVVERLADNPAALRLGGELRELSVLFCDIRGFTALAERLSPPQLTHVVNEVFTPLSDIVMFEQRGTIDKYIGDCLMAFWNAPLDEPEHALRACRAALAMQSAMGEINERLQRESPTLASVAVGIGINTGPCTVGNFGSRRHFNYSALGDAVNIAWRLQDATKRYGTPIVIGPETAARTPALAHLPIDLVRIKGRAAPVEIHALVGGTEFAESPAFIELKRMHLHFRAAYLERDWVAAEHLIEMLRRMPFPDLVPLYHQYAARVAALRQNPPPLDWDGVSSDA